MQNLTLRLGFMTQKIGFWVHNAVFVHKNANLGSLFCIDNVENKKKYCR